MTTLADLKKNVLSAPQSGVATIDALLNSRNAWVYLLPAVDNTLHYSFSITAGTESGVTGQAVFNGSQKTAVRQVMDYATGVTGIRFEETAEAGAADIHFAARNIAGVNDAAVSSIILQYSTDSSGKVLSLGEEAYLYLDNVEFAAENLDPAPGSLGYQVLLHEFGHVLGLKHPFSATEGAPAVLDAALDNTVNTLMSYNLVGGYQTAFQVFDLSALDYLYGGDGLGGINYSIAASSGTAAVGLTLTGSAGADKLVGEGGGDRLFGYAGNDKISGGGGDDWLVGSAGIDRLSGGSGADAFFFDYPNGGADKVVDFNAGEGDTLVFDSAVFTALADGIGAGNVVISTQASALDADDYLLLSTRNGKLFYDLDGSGNYAPILLAGVKGSLLGVGYSSFVVEGI
jgi:hypothetical protein